MANGGKIQKAFEGIFGTNGKDEVAASVTSPTSAQDSMLLLQMAMKCADLGHMSLSWDVHKKWVSRVEAEFFAQGDREKAAGLPVSFLMDRDKPGCSETQVGFFQFVVLPLFNAVARVAPSMQPMLDGVMANYEEWQALEGIRNCIQASKSRETGDSKAEASTNLPTQASSDVSETQLPAKKKSGRTRQRAAKYWASVRCRTPSPEPASLLRHLQRC